MANGYGPTYRRSAIWGEQEQRKALGMQPMTPAATAAAVRGELEPYYAFQLGEREKERQAGYTEQRLGFEEERVKQAWVAEERAKEQAESQERSDIISGVVGVGGLALAAAPAIAGIITGAGTAAAGASLAAAGATVVGTTATTGIWTTIGYALGGLIGCCFTFDAGGLLTENVRKYRDNHYDKLTSPISFGYRWMSNWLVPLMKDHKSIWSLTRFLMLKPLACYADWYYGDNSYGWLFYPQKVFFTNAWKVIGLMVNPETLFMKEVT